MGLPPTAPLTAHPARVASISAGLLDRLVPLSRLLAFGTAMRVVPAGAFIGPSVAAQRSR